MKILIAADVARERGIEAATGIDPNLRSCMDRYYRKLGNCTKMKLVSAIVMMFSCSIFLGCANTIEIPEDKLPHMLAINQGGDSFKVEIASGARAGARPDIDKQIEDIVDNIEAENKKNGVNNILLFVHGGLKPIEESVEEAQELTEEIRKYNHDPKRDAQKPAYYPIFVNWESGMDDAYVDHLWRIRQGREEPLLGPVTSPAYLAADIGRALTRLPVTYGYQGYNAIKPIDVASWEHVQRFNQEFYGETMPHEHGIWLGTDNQRTPIHRLWDKAGYAFPGVVKLLTTPALDTVGVSAWDNMLRRTMNVFRRSADYSREVAPTDSQSVDFDEHTLRPTKPESESKSPPSGALAKLMRKLRSLKTKDSNGPQYAVTLIGHSMGTIILNELLRKYSDKEQDLPYKNIVYMGAACSVSDFESAVIPYLRNNDETSFYNLTLHPRAEQNETYWDLLPRGSLLVWIDDFATKPSTRADLRLGAWNNAIVAWKFIPKGVRRRITLKGFGINDPKTNTRESGYTKPQAHGEFNDIEQKFWDPGYWKVPNVP